MQPMREYRRIERRFLVWQCVKSTELRGRRRGRPEGCQLWSIRGSSTPLKGFKNSKMQAYCCHCKNRPRIGAESIYQFDNKENALLHCEELNAGLI